MLALAWSILVLGGLSAIGAYYVLVLRPKWHDAPALRDFYTKVDAVEGCFWAKVNARLTGYRTAISLVIAELALSLPDVLPNLLPQLASFDWAGLGLSAGVAKAVGQLAVLAGIVFNVFRAGKLGAKPQE